MPYVKKRMCYLCEQTVAGLTRSFPSVDVVQEQWINRLGLSEEETKAKLDKHRLNLALGMDVRWCSIHFDTPKGLPIDNRPTPLLQSRPLRDQLQPDRLRERYRNPSAPVTPSVSDNEMDIDELWPDTPPLLSPSSSFVHRPLSPSPRRSRQLDPCNDEIAALPKRFKSEASMKSGTTIDQVSRDLNRGYGNSLSQGSDYVLSQEIDYESMEENQSDEDEEETGKKREIKYRIVGEEQLRSLFRRCQECSKPQQNTQQTSAETEVSRVQQTSAEYKFLEDLLCSKTFAKSFLQSSNLIDTAMNESFHSTALTYAPKRFACGRFYFRVKSMMIIMHHNSDVIEEMLGLRGEKRAFVVSRPGRIALSVKTKREKGKHSWRRTVMDTCPEVRKDLEQGRLMKRLGMPEDCVFDELMTWEEQKRAEEGLGDESGEEEEEEFDEDGESGEEEQEGETENKEETGKEEDELESDEYSSEA